MMEAYQHRFPSLISAVLSVASYSPDWHRLLPVANLSVAAATSGVSALPGTTEQTQNWLLNWSRYERRSTHSLRAATHYSALDNDKGDFKCYFERGVTWCFCSCFWCLRASSLSFSTRSCLAWSSIHWWLDTDSTWWTNDVLTPTVPDTGRLNPNKQASVTGLRVSFWHRLSWNQHLETWQPC